MLNYNDLATNEVGTTEFSDCKSRIHIVKHSVILSDVEKGELEEKITDDLYRIFTKSNK